MLRGLRRRTTAWLALAACALLAVGAAIGWAAGSGTPEAKRIPLAQSKHVRGAPDRTLGLTRVEIPAGAKLALHHHQGTQVDKGHQKIKIFLATLLKTGAPPATPG